MKRKTSESYICRTEFTILICLYFTACGEECSNPILYLWEGPPLLKPQLLNVHQDGTDVLLKYPFLIISMKNHVTQQISYLCNGISCSARTQRFEKVWCGIQRIHNMSIIMPAANFYFGHKESLSFSSCQVQQTVCVCRGGWRAGARQHSLWLNAEATKRCFRLETTPIYQIS